VTAEPARLFGDLDEGPPGGRAFALRAQDGTALRAVLWAPAAPRGSVLLLPGRTEYAEKYGPAAADLARRGLATLCIDWRGQGLSARPCRDPMVGHVARFGDYQQDLDALVALARSLDLPRPWQIMSHSMGGCIALRALMRPHPFASAVFSAPMWGILLAPAMRPLAWGLSALARPSGQDHRYAPGTGPQTYVATAPFQNNVLTTDPAMFAMMKRQVTAHPELALGGPSLGWVRGALLECRALARLPAPDLPALCVLGTAEKVVDPRPIHARMARWPHGRLVLVPGAEHEVMMEQPATRAAFFDAAAALFDPTAP
jgi:lysophospholipase